MPLPWVPAYEVPPVAQAESRVVQKFADDLVISAESSVADPIHKTLIFKNGVVATYGPTTIRADRLELYMAEGEQRAKAMGHVVIEDPEANMSAEDLDFTWKSGARAGTAHNIQISLGRVRIRAQEAVLSPERWTFTGVEGSHCPEYYWIKSPRLVLEPAKQGRLEKPTLYAGGRKIVTIPDRKFNLNPRTQGVSTPSLSYRKGQGLGVSWDAGWLLNEYTNLYVNAGSFKGSYPGLGIIATRSSVPVEKASSIITPASELGERFRYGYFETIEVDKPQREAAILRNPRKSLSVGTVWNQGIAGRTTSTTVSKALEVTYEVGGSFGSRLVKQVNAAGEEEEVEHGGYAYFGQVRLQDIREKGGPWVPRGVVLGSLELPSISFGPKLYTLSRIDTTQYVGKNGYGWIRGSAGVIFEPNKLLRVGAAAVASKSYGAPEFAFDELFAKRGFHGRIDLNLGSTKISYLTKYDTALKWYDREYIISQVAGCFEPFIVYRQFPSDYRYGLRLRVDDFYDLLQRRTFKRTKAVGSPPIDHMKRTVISEDRRIKDGL